LRALFSGKDNWQELLWFSQRATVIAVGKLECWGFSPVPPGEQGNKWDRRLQIRQNILIMKGVIGLKEG